MFYFDSFLQAMTTNDGDVNNAVNRMEERLASIFESNQVNLFWFNFWVLFKMIKMIEIIKKEMARRLDKLETEKVHLSNVSHQVRVGFNLLRLDLVLNIQFIHFHMFN